MICAYQYHLAVGELSEGGTQAVYDLGEFGTIQSMRWRSKDTDDRAVLELSVLNLPAHVFRYRPEAKRVQRTFTIDLGTDRVYREIEVARPVQPGANRPARYPEELRKEGAQGEVLVQFVVDTTGRVVENSLKILRATDFRFVPTVRDAVRDYVFRPALLSNGKKVRQMVQMPFQFQLR